MVKLTKIYTKTGDTGTTGLVGGARLRKTDVRVAAIGEVDELNACCGLAAAAMNEHTGLQAYYNQLLRIQQELFNLGAQLAVIDASVKVPQVDAMAVTRLERGIDEMNAPLPALNSFVLPGGNDVSARLHVARTVCRRAERVVWQLQEESPVDETALIYLNRLSDWLFVSARAVMHQLGDQEVLWKPQ